MSHDSWEEKLYNIVAYSEYKQDHQYIENQDCFSSISSNKK